MSAPLIYPDFNLTFEGLQALCQLLGYYVDETVDNIKDLMDQENLGKWIGPYVIKETNVGLLKLAIEAPELYGGALRAGHFVTSLDEANKAIETTGIMLSVSGLTLVGNIFNSLGINIKNDENGQNILQRVFARSIDLDPDTTSLEELKKYKGVIFKRQADTMLSEEYIQKVKQAMWDEGVFASAGAWSLDVSDVEPISGNWEARPISTLIDNYNNDITDIELISSAIGWIKATKTDVPTGIDFYSQVNNAYNNVIAAASQAINLDDYPIHAIAVQYPTASWASFAYVHVYFFKPIQDGYYQIYRSGDGNIYLNNFASEVYAWSSQYDASSAYSANPVAVTTTSSIALFVGSTIAAPSNPMAILKAFIDVPTAPEGIAVQEDSIQPGGRDTAIGDDYPGWQARGWVIDDWIADTEERRSKRLYPIDVLPGYGESEMLHDIDQDEAQSGTVATEGDATKADAKDKAQSTILDGIKDLIKDLTDSLAKATDLDISIDVPEGIKPIPGPTPIIEVPEGGGSNTALFTIYNPDNSDIRDLAGVLWEDNFIALVKALFQNPMDGIISLMWNFATPTTGTSQVIKLGTISSGVSAPVVTDQYTTINCGTVRVPEFYGDATDYNPYTQVSIFLPFIGIVDLATEDIIASEVNVTYYVDFMTGTCLAEIKVRKTGGSWQILYTYEGNCATELPLTGADRSRLMSGILSATAGIASLS